jgi:hypothetical protein
VRRCSLNALQVKQQADQLELLELSQMGADMAGKQEAERAHLAARHCKERDAASKKAASAVLAAQQRQGYEVEQLTRRHQVGRSCCRTRCLPEHWLCPMCITLYVGAES